MSGGSVTHSATRILRNRWVPLVVWLGVVAALIVHQQSKVNEFRGVGFVEARERVIAPSTNGVISTMAVDVLDRVEADEVVAVLDDSILAAELMTAEAELSRIRLQLRQEAAEQRVDLLRFHLWENEARLDYLAEKVRAESESVRLDRLERESRRAAELFAQQLISEEDFDATRLDYEALRASLEQRNAVLAAARQQLDTAVARLREYEQTAPTEAMVGTPASDQAAAIQDPVGDALLVQESRIGEILERRKALVLRAPVAGQIVRVLRRSGETALAGDPVLALTETDNNRVLAYVDGSAGGEIETGNLARIESLDRPGRTAVGTVRRIGETIEVLPRSLQSNPLSSSRALAVLIGELSDDGFFPGEQLSVVLTREPRSR